MRLTKKMKEELYQDFEEIPVSFEQFITDRNYLGNAWLDGNGGSTAWPFWVNQGKTTFPLALRSPYHTLILAGATGIGKTSFAVNMVMAYYLHIVLCLRDPHSYFDLADQKNIVFALLNIVTKTIAYKNAWGMLHKALIASPWFMARGAATTGKRPEWYCTTKPVELLYGSSPDHIIGLDILCCFLDEISFARIRNVQAAQERALELFNAAHERMKSRFTKFGGLYEGLMIMASSKRTDQAFMEVFTEQVTSGVDKRRVLTIDRPRWEVLPKGTYCGKTFPVAVGDKFMPSRIIKESEVPQYEDAGYKILYPPIETYGEFDRDLQNALTNIAGVSVTNLATFLRGDVIKKCIDPELRNPFVQSVIYVGTKDNIQYWDYFDLKKVPEEDFKKPLFIHLDASLGGDGNTITGVNVAYAMMQANQETGNAEPELHYKQVFKVKVKAPKGDQVMLAKNKQFIFWLRQQGFNIRKVTSDQYQSADFGQSLTNKRFDYSLQSIDRVTNGINQPYQVLRNALYEYRIKLFNDKDQTDELVALEKHEDGRVDKPLNGSDDAAQALCGAVYAASQAKAEYLRSNAILLENTVGTEQPMDDLPEDLVASLIAQSFDGSYFAPTPQKQQSIPGLRQTFDQYVDKNNQQDSKQKRRSGFNFF